MTKISTWMPLYIGDYLSDTMHLSAQEHGAYLLLIMNYWRNGPLPDDDKALASISKVERREWMREVGPVVRQFFVTQDGKLRHKRIDIELEAARENSHKKRLAAEARWAKRNAGGDPPAGPNGDAHAYADACAEDPIRICPSPSPSSSKEVKEGRKEDPPRRPPETPEPSASPLARPTRRGHRLPETWVPSEKDTEFARSLGLDPDVVLAEFRDYWLFTAGRGATKLDWAGTWRNRCRELASRPRPNPNWTAPSPKPSGVAAARMLEQMARGCLDAEEEEIKWTN